MRTYLLWALSLTTHVIQVIGRLRIWGQSLKVCGKWIFRTAKCAENKNSVENGSFPHSLQCGKVFPEWQSVEQTKQKCGKTLLHIIYNRVPAEILISSKKLPQRPPKLPNSKPKFFWKIVKNELSGAKIKFFKIFIRFGWNSYSEYIGQYYIQYKNLSQFGQVKFIFNF